LHTHSLPDAARAEVSAIIVGDMAKALITSETPIDNPVAVVHDLSVAGFGVNTISHLMVDAIRLARSFCPPCYARSA
jgi:hypothetical protein